MNSERSYEGLLDVCVQSALAQLRNYTTEQLDELLSSDSKIDALLEELPQVKNLPSEREAALAENKSLAEWNLGQEPRIAQLKNQVLKSHAQASNLKSEVDALKLEADKSCGGSSLDTACTLLEVAHKEADDDAEAIANEFYDGNMAVDIFLQQFYEKKTIAHTRKVKSERLKALLRDQQFAQPRPQSMPVPYPDAYPAAPPVGRHAFF